MQEHGKIICALQPREGVSQRTGEMWKSQSFVMEIDGRYTRRVMFSLFGADVIQRANLQIGQYITMSGEVEAHEYQGRWYNEIRAYDIQRNGVSITRAPKNYQTQPTNAPGSYQTQPTNAPGSYQPQPSNAPQTAQPSPQYNAPANQFAPGTAYQAQAFPGTSYPAPEVPPVPTQAPY